MIIMMTMTMISVRLTLPAAGGPRPPAAAAPSAAGPPPPEPPTHPRSAPRREPRRGHTVHKYVGLNRIKSD